MICRRTPRDRHPAPSWEKDPSVFRCLLTRNPDTTRFEGACLDTGATRTVIGEGQACAYARLTGGTGAIDPARPTRFLFGGVVTPSLGTVNVRVPIATELYAPLRVHVVALDIPLLIGLDSLEMLRLYVNNVKDRLKCDARGISTPLVRKKQHLYLEWDEVVHYTTTELRRLHRHFAYPHPERLAPLLERARDRNATPGTRAQLEELTRTCDVCQRLARAPGPFRVAFPPDEVVFNRTVLLDLMYLDGRSLLHVVDKDTLFGAAGFLVAVPAAADRDVTPGSLVSVYREPPVDQWVGPHEVVSHVGKTVWLAVDGHLKQFGIEKVKAYLAEPPHPVGERTVNGPVPESPPRTSAPSWPPTPEPTHAPVAITSQVAQTTSPTAIPGFSPDPSADATSLSGDWIDKVITGEQMLCRVRGGCHEYLTSVGADGTCNGPLVDRSGPAAVGGYGKPTYLTEVLPPNDPRIQTARFQDAARKEVKGLRSRGAFQTVDVADVPHGANVIKGRFFFTLENVGTTGEVSKAR